MAADPQPPADLPSRGWVLGVVLWPSFLAACGASLLFFAVVDPLQLRDSGPRIFDSMDREAGYALGLLFFWAVSAIASALTLCLVRGQKGGSK